MTRALSIVVFALAFATTGCGPTLRQEKTVPIPPGGRVFEIDPIKKEQKVRIVVEAPEAPVDVFAYTDKTRELAEANVFKKSAEGFLGLKRNEQKHDFTVTVPANETLFVSIQRTRAKAPGDVKVKISN